MLEKIIVPLTLIFVTFIVALSAVSLFIDVPSPLRLQNGRSIRRLIDISELTTENLNGINKIELTSNGKINLKRDAQPFFDIQQNNDKLGFYIDNDTIKIGLKNRYLFFFGSPDNKNFVINLGLSEINSLEVNGGGEINIDGLQTTDLETGISGSGDLNVTNLTATTVDSKISGSGKVNIDGVSNNVEVDISGSGEFNGQELETKSASTNISGSGEIRINAIENLDVDISGSGKVEYQGKPEINQNISGSGVVRRFKTN